MQNEETYLRELGRRILAEANDLKRTPEALARDLGHQLSDVLSIINGESDRYTAKSLVTEMCEKYPISFANVWIEPDDTDAGVKIMRAPDSASTARVFSRKDSSGGESSYYEYRDTVMSRTAGFKPEWIQPMRIVEDSLPANPDVAFNKGHLMHQCTFFIGEVNFYWEINGTKYAAEMNTGDSNYITPFVPHSFTSRNPDKPGLIIAVTFGGEVRNALHEFSKIGHSALESISDRLHNKNNAFKSRLDRYLNSESLDDFAFIKRLSAAGMKLDDAREIVSKGLLPSITQLKIIAEALNIREYDLSAFSTDIEETVIITRSRDNEQRFYPSSNQPAYQLRELARTPNISYLRGHDITVLGHSDEITSFCHHLHEYVYNYGEVAIQLNWNENRKEIIKPGDSVYIQPMIKHSFNCKGEPKPGHLVSVRIPGGLTDSAISEFSRYPKNARSRVIQEQDKWF